MKILHPSGARGLPERFSVQRTYVTILISHIIQFSTKDNWTLDIFQHRWPQPVWAKRKESRRKSQVAANLVLLSWQAFLTQEKRQNQAAHIDSEICSPLSEGSGPRTSLPLSVSLLFQAGSRQIHRLKAAILGSFTLNSQMLPSSSQKSLLPWPYFRMSSWNGNQLQGQTTCISLLVTER